MKGKLLVLAGFAMISAAVAFAPSVYAYMCDLGSSGGSAWSLGFTGNNGFNDLEYRSGPIGVAAVPSAMPERRALITSEEPAEVAEVSNDYLVGFKSPDTCDVEIIAAASWDDAMYYAKEECPDCAVEDLSNTNIAQMNDIKDKSSLYTESGFQGESPYIVISQRDAYCRLVE